MATLYLHIGYPKTATTSLQKSIFSNISSHKITFKGSHVTQDKDFIKNFSSSVNKGVPLANNFFTGFKNLIISCEGVISDSIRNRGYEGEFAPFNHQSVAERTSKAVLGFEGKIKIIIVLRKQTEIIHSFYTQAYTHWFSEWKELNNFRKYVTFLLNSEAGQVFDYAYMVRTFHAQFGEKNVCVLFYEDLANGGTRFLEELSNFMSFPLTKAIGFHNVRKMEIGRKSQAMGLGDDIAKVKRKLLPTLNFGLGRMHKLMNRFTFSRPEIIPFDEASIELIYSHYSTSNIVLSELVDRKLSTLGYYDNELFSSND